MPRASSASAAAATQETAAAAAAVAKATANDKVQEALLTVLRETTTTTTTLLNQAGQRARQTGSQIERRRCCKKRALTTQKHHKTKHHTKYATASSAYANHCHTHKAPSNRGGGGRCTMTMTWYLTTTILLLPLCYMYTCCSLQVLVSGSEQHLAEDSIRLRHDDVHKLMSEQDLRRTFQVHRHDLVPEYEILKLTVNDDGSHLISPISDLGELAGAAIASPQQHDQYQTSSTKHLDPKQLSASASAAAEAAASTSKTSHERSSGSSVDDSKPTSSDTNTEAKATTTTTTTTTASHDALHRNKRDAAAAEDKQQQQQQQDDEDKLIVMKLSTFGKDFKLRLKRNADFQQRIKDMKMFMAESTSDGQLRYTQINNSQQQHRDQTGSAHQRLDLDKRSAGDGTDESNASSSSSSSSSNKKQHTSVGNEPSAWNIGSTYHDEDNLAALLIDHDARTGQLKVDGTIGNDFVIKPMPQSAIDALVAKRQQQQQQQQQRDREAAAKLKAAAHQQPQQEHQQARESNNSNNSVVVNNNNAIQVEASASIELDRAPTTLAKSGGGGGGGGEPQNGASTAASSGQQHDLGSSSSSVSQPHGGTQRNTSDAANLEHALHMHDDDPHDDDEMFLDEDEAIELAHLKHATPSLDAAAAAAAAGGAAPFGGSLLNRTDADVYMARVNRTAAAQTSDHLQPLSKAASERKWKKYRKLMAQTQVPKPGALASASAASSSSSRARRELSQPNRKVSVSHHIVYRQKPSSEASSSEHKHSMLAAPSDLTGESMQRLAASLRVRRSDADDESQMTDSAPDPFDGQFLLEPGDLVGRGAFNANADDWSLFGARRRAPLKRSTRSASNATNDEDDDDDLYDEDNDDNNSQMNHSSQLHMNASSIASQANITAHPTQQHHTKRMRATAEQRNGDNKNNRQQQQQQQHNRFKRHAGRNLHARNSQVRRKRHTVETVWPEVLLVVDYDSFLLHNGDSRDVKRYFVSFWNGVDLRYKLLVHPHIRISLAGMIVAKDRDATPYLERNRLRAPNADAVDAAGALTDMGKYLYREDRLPTYDLAVVITKLDMCRRRYEGGRCNRGTAGFAYVGGACVVNKRLEKVNSVAIIEDSGGFSGIIVAAHEVGHLLGCVHDGSPPPSYLGGPGATHCPWEDGFIMSDLRHTERGFRWSQCSVEQFKHFLNGETATCLYNYPHESQMLHRLLPGTMLTLDEQCKRDRGTNACFKDARVCAQLFCFDSASGYCVSYRPAAEGSPCGEGQVCRNGKCVGEIENIIPDYTHQTVVARRPPPGLPHVPRLADNGLSASSTSTATTSPDAKSATAAAAAASVQPAQPPQLSSRMDSGFTLATDQQSPTSGSIFSSYSAASPSSYSANPQRLAPQQQQHFGGRYAAARELHLGEPINSSPPIVMRTSMNPTRSTTAAAVVSQQYQLRSGQQAQAAHSTNSAPQRRTTAASPTSLAHTQSTQLAPTHRQQQQQQHHHHQPRHVNQRNKVIQQQQQQQTTVSSADIERTGTQPQSQVTYSDVSQIPYQRNMYHYPQQQQQQHRSSHYGSLQQQQAMHRPFDDAPASLYADAIGA